MEIFYATVEDLPEIVPLFKGYLQFYERNKSEEEIKIFLNKRLLSEESIILLAKKEGKVIGFTQLYPSFSTLALKRCYVLNDLFVKENSRGMGAARALMEEAFAFCEQAGAKYISLETHPENTAAQKLYESIGMTRDDEFWHYVKHF